MPTVWTPKPGMRIRNTLTNAKAVITKINHEPTKDGAGRLWEIREDGAPTDAFIYEAHMFTYWEPVEEKKP